MKLLGRDIRPDALMEKLEARLRQRGVEETPQPIELDGVEPRVDPAAFYLSALEAHADPAEPLPLHTHRGGIGRGVLVAKLAFRKVSRLAVVDILARQRMFNGYTRDAFLEVFNELRALREAVEMLRAERGAASRPAPARPAKVPRSTPRKKR